tara:strand:+ start:45 stop:245 length:201 start_codon:yes stop_codon:yes gene_type:complete
MAITVDTIVHDATDLSKIQGSEASSAGVLPKDVSTFLADGDTIISISHVFLPALNVVATTVVKDSD